jgi:farnesyl-diphosphate farnesyltransferase
MAAPDAIFGASMPSPMLSADRAYCRALLPRVSRTFALNIRLLRGRLGEAVRAGYLLCRASDALEDSWPGSPEAIQGRFALLRAAMAGDFAASERLALEASRIPDRGPDLDLVAHLPRVWRVYQSLEAPAREALASCLDTMSDGMCRYAARAAGREAGAPYLDTEAELHDYCWVVAGCVGVMLTRLFEREVPVDADLARRRLELSPVVGQALQLTNILLDWPTDIRRGRCYVPAAWLRPKGLTPDQLVGAERPGARELSDRLEALARGALARVPDYLDTIPPGQLRYRLFCLWPCRWALASLEQARRDREFPWGPRRPRIPRTRLWGEAWGAFAAPDGAMLRAATATVS